MKNLNLENYGVQEMDAKEMANVDGGGFFGALIGFVVGATLALLGGGVDFTHGDQTVKTNSDNWFAAGLIGASVGGVLLPF